MLERAHLFFASYYKKKHLAHWNHDIHFLHRDQTWIKTGVEQILSGTFSPGCTERLLFKDGGAGDHLSIRDRVLLRVIYEELKPTFSHVMNPRCYHLQGPNGVARATADIKQALTMQKARYFIRADVKGYYASIRHDLLIQDLKTHYQDPRLMQLLSQCIKTPIKTQKGYINPDKGIAIRSPLSGFFSGLYLKNLDDAFSHGSLEYFRYQDDILILCPSYRSFKRAKQKLQRLLKQKQLSLAAKKTKTGTIEQGFHFLGIDYLGTQPLNHTNSLGLNQESGPMFLRRLFHPQTVNHPPNPAKLLTVPHARTLRRARLQVGAMVEDGASHPQIKTYLKRWACWWQTVIRNGSQEKMMSAFEYFNWNKWTGLEGPATCLKERRDSASRVISFYDNSFCDKRNFACP